MGEKIRQRNSIIDICTDVSIEKNLCHQLVRNLRGALDFRVHEDIRLIAALCGELRDDRSFVPSLKPVRCVRRQCILLTGLQDNFMPDVVGLFTSLWWASLGIWRRLTWHI